MEVRIDATQSAVIVPVPVVEPFVAEHRRALDRAAAWGVPAHGTVLYPFVAPNDLTQQTMDRLAAVVASVPAFECVLSHVDWFGNDVAWLRPEGAAWDSFVALTRAVWQAFPDYPPYGEAYGDEIAPHVTIGESRLATVGRVRAAAADVAAHLPVEYSVREALLIAGREAPGSWQSVRRLPLG
jgi:2'-5' RNA ligase